MPRTSYATTSDLLLRGRSEVHDCTLDEMIYWTPYSKLQRDEQYYNDFYI
jgi:hypothetical protein